MKQRVYSHLTRNRRALTKIEFLVTLVVLVVIWTFLLSSVKTAKYTRRPQCASNMKRLSEALNTYHETYEALPPCAAPIDEQLQDESVSESCNWSWRVRILPFLRDEGAQELYSQFRFNEPWDSEHNLKVAASDNAWEFLCCADGTNHGLKEVNGRQIPVTNYVMITGPNTVGPVDGSVRTWDDVTDDKSKTLILVEVWGENRPAWTEPVDITLEDLQQGVNAVSGMSISGDHLIHVRPFIDDLRGGVNLCFADGHLQFVNGKKAPTPEQLRQMAIINDGEPTGSED